MDKEVLEASLSGLDRWAICALIVLAIGAVGAAIVGFLQWRTNDQLRAIQTAENLAQQKEILRLSSESDASRAAIAQANKETAIAQQNAMEAKLELEKFKAPRTLSVEQQKRIYEKLLAFKLIQFDAATVNESEAVYLLDGIEQILVALDWKETAWPGDPNIHRNGKQPIGQAVEVGISVQVDASQPELEKAAKALSAALVAEGISARAEFTPPNSPSKNKDVLHLIIGKKI
ncbi:hypothetical protein LJR029_005476 [Caballeronia sp. LjRoot29]|uniref:hypothetical protein n=1 Tax=Caballeronia sp. LjRoot29 TaxID=3342315 RepID=UPI003ECFCD2F